MKNQEEIEEPLIRFERANVRNLPSFDNVSEVDVDYDLIPQFANAHIMWSSKDDEIMYNVVEPHLSSDEEETLDLIKEKMIEDVDADLKQYTQEEIVEYLTEKFIQVSKELDLGFARESSEDGWDEEFWSKKGLVNVKRNEDEEFVEWEKEKAHKSERLLYYVLRDFAGLGKIEALMRDPYVEDISCDGLGIPIYVLHSKYGSIQTNIKYEDRDRLNSFVVKLAQRCGKYISYADPYIDGRLPDGSRVNTTYEREITSKGSTFTVRKFSADPFSPVDLVVNNTCSPRVMAYIWYAVEKGASFLIAGETGSGKTTLLNTISFFVPPDEKVISIEDTRELKLPCEHWIPAVSRKGHGPADKFGEKNDEVGMYELLREGFRQNPDYVLVGEIRGEEASVLFQGINAGHTCLGTIHGESISSVTKRLQLPPVNLEPENISGLDVFIHMKRANTKREENTRRVGKVQEIVGADPENDAIETETSFLWDSMNDDFEAFDGLLEAFADKNGINFEVMREELDRREDMISRMADMKLDTDVVEDIFDKYMRVSPEKGMEKLRQVEEQNESGKSLEKEGE